MYDNDIVVIYQTKSTSVHFNLFYHIISGDIQQVYCVRNRYGRAAMANSLSDFPDVLYVRHGNNILSKIQE